MLGDYHAKREGQGVEKVGIDFGKYEDTVGLTFLCLSRAKWVMNLLVEPVPLDRRFEHWGKITLRR